MNSSFVFVIFSDKNKNKNNLQEIKLKQTSQKKKSYLSTKNHLLHPWYPLDPSLIILSHKYFATSSLYFNLYRKLSKIWLCEKFRKKKDIKTHSYCQVWYRTIVRSGWNLTGRLMMNVLSVVFIYLHHTSIQVIKHLELRGLEDLKFISLEIVEIVLV